MEQAAEPMFISVGRALLGAVERFSRKGGWVMSSHIAMTMMLALFPFILFIIALAGFLSQDVDTADLVDLVFGAWPDEIAGPIVSELEAVMASSSVQLMTIGGVLTLYFASNGVDAVRVPGDRAHALYRQQIQDGVVLNGDLVALLQPCFERFDIALPGEIV